MKCPNCQYELSGLSENSHEDFQCPECGTCASMRVIARAETKRAEEDEDRSTVTWTLVFFIALIVFSFLINQLPRLF
ncbi:MAG TPA: hypothetical protein VG711_02370 [Phycisphaerales bacterium]|nr:hypothetical protein [Phycisphaerales bacterium]